MGSACGKLKKNSGSGSEKRSRKDGRKEFGWKEEEKLAGYWEEKLAGQGEEKLARY